MDIPDKRAYFSPMQSISVRLGNRSFDVSIDVEKFESDILPYKAIVAKDPIESIRRFLSKIKANDKKLTKDVAINFLWVVSDKKYSKSDLERLFVGDTLLWNWWIYDKDGRLMKVVPDYSDGACEYPRTSNDFISWIQRKVEGDTFKAQGNSHMNGYLNHCFTLSETKALTIDDVRKVAIDSSLRAIQSIIKNESFVCRYVFVMLLHHRRQDTGYTKKHQKVACSRCSKIRIRSIRSFRTTK